MQRAQESAEQYLLENKLPVVNEGTVGINVSYEIDLFGKLRRGVEAARADSEAVRAAGDLARITVVADVVRAYVESCSAGDELAVAKQSLALQKQRVALSQRLRDAGRGNQTDVTRGVTQVRTLAADIPRFEGRRKVAQYQLAALLARSPADLPKAVAECERLPKLRQPIPIGDGAALLRRRPDVRAAERQLAAATARIGVATAALYPSISIGASAGSVGVAADLFSSTTNRWSFGPLISWSFPVNGQRARVREAEATTGGALAHFDGVVLNALRETQSSLATYAADVQRTEALRTAYESARNSADETHRLYLAGRESFISDLDATRTLTSAQAQVAAAEGQVATDQVRLFLALGGGGNPTVRRPQRTPVPPRHAPPRHPRPASNHGSAVVFSTSRAPGNARRRRAFLIRAIAPEGRRAPTLTVNWQMHFHSSFAAALPAASTRRSIMRTSARNHFAGQVSAVKTGAVNDEITLRTQDGLDIVAVITHGSAASLGLAAGSKAFALVKASSVIVMVDVDSSRCRPATASRAPYRRLRKARSIRKS